MLDPPQPTYGRFTVPPAELQPRDASDWLEDAEDRYPSCAQSIPAATQASWSIGTKPHFARDPPDRQRVGAFGRNVRDRITIPYGNDLLGDLAEEFHLRTELDGLTAAQAWYRRPDHLVD